MEQATDNKKRPLTVWCTQFLIALFGLSFAIGFFRGGIRSIGDTGPLGRWILGGLGGLLVMAIWVVTLWELGKRTKRGKWLGVFSLLLIWLPLFYRQHYPLDAPIKPYTYNNEVQVAGARAGQLIINALFVLLILRLAYSKKVNRFFEMKGKNITG